jgi:hypothetical protein
VIRFPPGISIGRLKVRVLGGKENWSDFAEAVGGIAIPPGKEVRLEISPTGDFDATILSGLDPMALTEFQWVSTSLVSDSAIAHIQHLVGLKGLALWETNIGNEALKYVGKLINLRWLDIGDTRVTDAGLRYLRHLSSLNYLTLLNDRISDAGLFHLQNLMSLEGLDLMKTSLSDKGVDVLCKMHQLRNLRIVNAGITEGGYRRLKSKLTGCQIRYHHPHRG